MVQIRVLIASRSQKKGQMARQVAKKKKVFFYIQFTLIPKLPLASVSGGSETQIEYK